MTNVIKCITTWSIHNIIPQNARIYYSNLYIAYMNAVTVCKFNAGRRTLIVSQI